VGASKSSPIIFNAALSAQGVIAEESIYVDDYKVEAGEAWEQGFTVIDRFGKEHGECVIHSLTQLLDYVNSVS